MRSEKCLWFSFELTHLRSPISNLQSEIKKLCFLISLLFFPTVINAQIKSDLPTGDPLEYYYRLLQLNGTVDETASFTLRPFTPSRKINDETIHPWQLMTNRFLDAGKEGPAGIRYALIEPVWFQSWNSTLPRGVNDGAIWQGKGYNTALSAGILANWGPLHIRFQPQVGFVQNADFDLGDLQMPSGVFEYSTPIRRIDNVRRFGPDPYSWFDPGDSYAELRMWGLKAGFSNARFWTGPAIHNPLFFSYNAPGFKHVHLATYRPLVSPIGDFEFKYQYGALQKSDWLDDRPGDNLNSIVSLHIAYSPSFMNGLTIGFNRLFMDRYPAGFSGKWTQVKKVFEAVLRDNLPSEEDRTETTESNQMASIYYRWVLPGYGFEVYGEFGRNDYNMDWRDFRLQPDHHRAYLFGLLKTMSLSGNRLLSINIETTQLNANRTTLTRGGNPWEAGPLGRWYIHRYPNFGFTNRGQIVGAGIGQVSQTQVLSTHLFHPKGSYGLKFARISYADVFVDDFFSAIRRVNDPDIERWEVRNIELMAGLSATRFLSNDLEISAALDLSFIMNHNYVRYNDKVNARFEITVRKHLEGWLR
ncbi:MAG: capsule assembly Wzi family protein [Candidatus Paceibacterota bacterium]